jgi:hypothetical protein
MTVFHGVERQKHEDSEKKQAAAIRYKRQSIKHNHSLKVAVQSWREAGCGSGVVNLVPRRFQRRPRRLAWPVDVGLGQGSISQSWVPMELLCLRCCNKHPFTIVSDFISISWMVGLDSLVPRAQA